MATDCKEGEIVVAYFRVAMPDHRHDYVPHTGVVKKVSPKTCLVEVSGREYRVAHNLVHAVYDNGDLARNNID